jgi:hypothetical protein
MIKGYYSSRDTYRTFEVVGRRVETAADLDLLQNRDVFVEANKNKRFSLIYLLKKTIAK